MNHDPVNVLLGVVAMLMAGMVVLALIGTYSEGRRRIAEAQVDELRALLEDAEDAIKPQPNLFALLLRIAPSARLSVLSDALYEQGFVVDMVATAPFAATTYCSPPPGPSDGSDSAPVRVGSDET